MDSSSNSNTVIRVLVASLRERLEAREDEARERAEKKAAVGKLTLKEGSTSASSSSSLSDSSTCSSIAEPKPLKRKVSALADEFEIPFSLSCFPENDDCDEAEKLARAERIKVILQLSAKAKADEAERKRAANIQPLTWSKPTFVYPSSSSSIAAAQVSQAATLGHRKERQYDPSNFYSVDRMWFPSRQPTEEEVQALIDVVNKYVPSLKRKLPDDSKEGDEDN